MGNSYHVHIGGYAEIEFPTRAKKVVRVLCKNCGVERPDGTSLFCGQCGGVFESIDTVENRSYTLWDLMGRDYNNLRAIYPEEHGGEHVILISNYVGDDISLDNESLVEPLTEEEIKATFDHFRTTFACDFGALEKQGATITLHYGVVAYWC